MLSIVNLSEELSGGRRNALKTFTCGTHRSLDPQETLERIRPLMRMAGITRLADITGLDRVSIPVILCVRPNSKSITCSAGKGITTVASMVSAAMEGIETYMAEELKPNIYRKSYREIEKSGSVIDRELLPLSKHSLFHEDLQLDWVSGWDIIQQTPIVVPFSLVSMSNRRSSYDLSCFQTCTNGIASGNNLPEACASALAEVIERDAVTCNKFKLSATLGDALDPESIPFLSIKDLLGRLEEASVHTVIRDSTSESGVPTFEVYLSDKTNIHNGVYAGYGCHLNAEVALCRAVTEAAQSRTVVLAGARDDFFKNTFHLAKYLQGHLAMKLLEEKQKNGLRQYPDYSCGFFEDDIDRFRNILVRMGLPQAIVVPLSSESFPVSVVKVIVPGLEGPMIPTYIPGKRARSICAQ